MRVCVKMISRLSLVLLTAPAALFLDGRMPLDRVKTLMLIATGIWFISAAAGMLWNHDAPDA